VELKHIKELMAAMGRTATKKLSLKKDDFELVLEREENGSFKNFEIGTEGLEETNPMRGDIERHRAAASPMHADLAQGDHRAAHAVKEDITSSYVTSPMVGTFYLSPSPDDPVFVKVGSKVEKNSPVCIIEAMKVMNEVKSGVSGTIAEILVENGHPVEFGTKLFRIT
jgi:acetyl-CoA carboxylase biotin carboxyl carrier protein